VLRIGSVRQKTADISLASGQSIGPRKQREQSSLVTEIIHDRNFRFFWRTELSAFSRVSYGNCQAQFCNFETGASQRDTTSDQRANHRCESIRRVLDGARVSTIRANTSKFVQKRISVQKSLDRIRLEMSSNRTLVYERYRRKFFRCRLRLSLVCGRNLPRKLPI
jgi:hypothetical protein